MVLDGTDGADTNLNHQLFVPEGSLLSYTCIKPSENHHLNVVEALVRRVYAVATGEGYVLHYELLNMVAFVSASPKC